ncbi:MAG: hypothetical protein U9Q22_05860 [Candidatus Altiarchaeota archaeon]|nr:hypothetical protein [Candidatus Altiarchaeota archaeon]
MSSKILSISVMLLLFTVAVMGENTSSLSALESGIIQVDSVDMVIDQNGLVSVSEKLVVQRGDRVAILIPGNVRELQVSDSGGTEVSYESTPEGDKQLIAFFLDESGGEDEEIIVVYNTQQLTAKVGEIWSIRFSATATPQHTILKINFPGDSRITSMDPEDLYWTPIRDSELWVYPQIKEFYFKFEYKIGTSGPIIPKSTTTSPTTTLPASVVHPDDSLIGPAVILILVVTATLFVLKRRRKDKKKIAEGVEGEAGEGESLRVKTSIMGMLDENEKRIVEILGESGGEEITQAYIYKSTGIPKSSLSDTMKRLERRNIIERKREGRTNWIRLKEWVFEQGNP